MADPVYNKIIREIPQLYKSPQNLRREWEAALRQGVGSYIDQIEKSVQDFASARPIMLSVLKEYEKDETAERILREYVEEKLNGVPMQLLYGDFARVSREEHVISPVIVIDEPGVDLDEDMDRLDRRSVTMAAEPMTPPRALQEDKSMAPPPRPFAPMTPVTPFRDDDVQVVGGPSRQRSSFTLSASSEALDPFENHQSGKRPAESFGAEEQGQHSVSSSSKRAKTSSANIISPVRSKAMRSVGMFEAGCCDYIFKDARCGPGWYVIQCNIGQMQFVNPPTRFAQHPLKDNLALEHFNKKLPCHSAPRKGKYTEETIIQQFSFRVYANEAGETDPTDEEVEESNQELHEKVERKKLSKVYRDEESSKAKGKRKAANRRPRTDDERTGRSDTQETDGSYHEEHS